MKKNIYTMVIFVLMTSIIYGQQKQYPLSILPSLTDKEINTFDKPHSVYFNPSVKSRNQLVVYIPGTGSDGSTGVFVNSTAGEVGFHAISLTYDSGVPATICRQHEEDEDCFEKFRLEIITGQDKSPVVNVNRANSIENRLQKLLVYLKQNYSKDGWGRYLTDKNEIRWENLILSGQSQGGGHAALMAKYNKVARVIMYSSPKDYDRKNKRPARWYSQGKTPIKRFYAFVHVQDRSMPVVGYSQQLEIFKQMGLYEFGEPVNVDEIPAPFKNSRILVTNYPGTEIPPLQAHTSMVTDNVTPKNKDGVPLFKPVWIHMFTAK